MEAHISELTMWNQVMTRVPEMPDRLGKEILARMDQLINSMRDSMKEKK